MLRMLNIPGLFLFFCLGVSASEAREFTSADGSKQMEAGFISYDIKAGTVELRLSTGRKIVALADSFSEADRRYFKDRYARDVLEDAIDVRIDRKIERMTDRSSGKLEYEYKNYKYDFVVQNMSDLELKNAKFKSWIVVERDNKGESKIETVENKKKITSLGSREKMTIEVSPVKLIQEATSISCSTCPIVRNRWADRAAKIDRDRIVGVAIEIKDEKGKVLYRHSDSKRALAVIASLEEK